MTRLEILEGCLKVVQDKLLIDGELLALEDLNKLKSLQFQLYQWTLAEKQEAYAKSIREFINHMNSEFPTGDAENSDDAWDKFYSTDFVVTFGKKSVSLYNSACTFNAIYDLLKGELVEYESE